MLFICFSCKNNNIKIDSSQAVVQDYTDFFTETEEEQLSKKIINYEALTTNEISIYTIDSIPNQENALFYATRLSNKLGVGKKELDNGLLLLISRYDKKVAIATGNSTEKVITDSISEQIVIKTIIPNLKEKNYYQATNLALDSIFKKWN